jgi:arginyl-tRNA synthetase
MFLSYQARVRETISLFLKSEYNVEPRIVMEQPPRPEFGDLALTFAFELAKSLRRPPRKIAEEVIAKLPPIPGVARMEPAGAGYVNVFFDRAAFATEMMSGAADRATPGRIPTGKVIVEHTNINPNKAAHIGHLRNAALGDTFVRILRGLGCRVEVQNYIDNTGVQVGDVVVGFEHLEHKSAADAEALIADPAIRFDYYCWDLYARVSRYFEEDKPRAAALRGTALQKIEHGVGDTAHLGEVVARAIVRAHLKTMERMGVEYDLLPRESEILHLKFWEQAFEHLKERGAIYLETDGKNKGCWVMRADSSGEATEESADADPDASKVIVRSNGTVTYVGKDIAYQLWKFGLLGRSFRYVPFQTYPDGRVLWMSATEGETLEFGGASRVYNVIDTRQSYLQNIVVMGLRALGYNEQADNSVHFSYEVVALSPRCCKELGIALSEEDAKRPYIEVSGRKGLGVKADDLMDTLYEKARFEVHSRRAAAASGTSLETTSTEQTARQIATAALRFFLLKFTRNTVIAFDFEEALSFDGETGPYCQYAVVRAANILRKASNCPAPTAPAVAAALTADELWQLLMLASQTMSAAEQSLLASEPAVLAKYAFQLAQAFNTFYHRHHILREEDAGKQAFLLWLADLVRRQLLQTLEWLGIEVPQVM